jgi:predicted outer membrane lipoprotein
MTASRTDTVHTPPAATARPGRAVTLLGTATALACLAFAAVNIAFESTGDFLDGTDYAAYAAGFTVMNWLVVALKLAGAATALLSIHPRPRPRAIPAIALALWGAFATLGAYALGSLAQAITMAATDPDRIDPAGIAYVLGFLLAATGFGILAAAWSRRHHLNRRLALLGALAAPAVLGTVLLAAPAILAALGMLPTA